jgi:hypothetical protein
VASRLLAYSVLLAIYLARLKPLLRKLGEVRGRELIMRSACRAASCISIERCERPIDPRHGESQIGILPAVRC